MNFLFIAQREVDWTAVDAKVTEIEDAVRTNGQRVVALATSDNEQIGTTISGKVQQSALTAAAILAQARQAIEAQTLNATQVDDLSGQVRAVMGKLLGSITTDLQLLTPAVSEQIRAVFEETFDAINLLAAEISALLGEPVPTSTVVTFAIDWQAVADKVNEIAAGVVLAGEKVSSAASSADAVIGEGINAKLEQAKISVEPLLQQANDAVSQQTLTDAQARGITGQLKSSLGKLLGSIQPELAQLGPVVANQIRAVITALFDAINTQSIELTALLAA